MGVERKARRADGAQHRIAQLRAVIELIAVGGLEQQAAEMDGLHQQAVAQLERLRIDVPRIGQVRSGGLLAAWLGLAAHGR